MSIALAVPPELTDAYRFRPGQHLMVRVDARRRRRCGAPIRSRSGPDDHELWVTVKRVDGGLFSSHAHQHFKPGRRSRRCRRPGASWCRRRTGGHDRIVAIAAGSGITPVMAMIRQVLAREPESRFTLIYGNRTFDSIIFREALDDLKDRYLGRLTVVHVLSREADADVPCSTATSTPRRSSTADLAGQRPRRRSRSSCAGPGSLIKDASRQLKAMGVPRERIHFEYFQAGPEVAERPSRPAPQPCEQRRPGRRCRR